MSASTHSETKSPNASGFAKFVTILPVEGSTIQSVGLFILRAAMVTIFLHGLHKATGYSGFVQSMEGMPIGGLAPGLFGFLVVAGQLLLGFGLLLGLATRWCGLFLALMFAFIILIVNIPFNGFINPDTGGIAWESSLYYFIPALTLVFTGPGRYSLDYLLSHKGR